MGKSTAELRLRVLANPTWRCNSGVCKYCWLNSTIRQRPKLLHAEERPLEDWVRAIRREMPYSVDIAGGEPMLLPWIGELIASVPEVIFGLTTNGLRTEELYEQIWERKGKLTNLVGVSISYHPAMEKLYPHYRDSWCDSVALLRTNEIPVSSNIVSYHDTYKQSEFAVWYLSKLGVPWCLSPYEDMMLLENPGPSLFCQAGKSHIVVAPDGTTWPCLTTLRSPSWKDHIIGNWLDGTVDVSRVQQPCSLYCLDHFVLEDLHPSGDMWGIKAKLA